MVRRSAFTLIELVFAIVIFAITVVSVPIVMQVNSRGMEGAIDQEAVFAASAKLMQTLAYPWDEFSSPLDAGGAVMTSGVLDITGGTSSLDFNSTTCRPGFISRFCLRDVGSNPIVISTLNSDQDPSRTGMDERIEANRVMDVNATTTGTATSTAATYKATYRMDVDVLHVSDADSTAGTAIDYNATDPFNGNTFLFSTAALGGGQASHLKMISVSIKDQNNRVITTLRAYAANIGEPNPRKKTY